MNAADATPSLSRVPFYHTIRGRLMLLAFAAIAPLLLFVAFNIFENVERSRAVALRDTLVSARTVAARIDDHVQNADSLLLAVCAMVGPDLDAVGANDAKLRALQADLPDYFRSISVLAPDGRMLSSSTVSPEERKQLNYMDRGYFREALAQRGLAFDEPVISRTSGKWVIIAARPLLSADGSIRAVVSMSTLMERFQDLLTPEGLPPGSVMTVLSQQGAVLARSVAPEQWVGKNLAKSPHFQRALAEREFSAETVASDDVKRLAAYTTAKRVPWIVYVGIPSSVAQKSAQADLARLSALGLVVLAAAAALAYLLARSLSRPIEAVAAAARLAATGKLDQHITPAGAAEIRVVADQINAMLESLGAVERTLRDSEARLQLAMLAGRIGLQEWNHVTGEVYISPEWKRMLGYEDRDVASTLQAWQELIHPDDQSRVRAGMEACFADRRPTHEIEFRLRHRDGEYRWVLARADPIRNAEGRPQRSVVCFVDITERRQAEEQARELLLETQRARAALLNLLEDQKRSMEALRVSEAKLRKLIDGLGPYMFVGLMTPDGVLIEANAPALAAAGLTAAGVLGKPFEQTYWWAYSETIQRELRVAIDLAAAGAPSRYDVQVRVGDAALIWIDFSIQPLRDDAGQVVFLIPSAVVITERKQAEQKLRDQFEELQRWYEATLGREDRVQEIKREVNELLRQRGEPARYASEEVPNAD